MGSSTYVTKNAALLARVGDTVGAKVTVDTASTDGAIVVAPEHLLEVARFCRDDAVLAMDVLHLISGVDWPDKGVVEVVYHLESYAKNHVLVLKTTAPRMDPVVPSVVALWPAADWMERETYDLIGVLFEGHPNLRRILCSEDWEGHPLRKDYAMPAYYHGIPNIFFLEQLSAQQKELLFGGMTEENRRHIYGE